MNTEYDPTLEQEQTKKETDVKCPNCGATIEFDPASGHMKCEYCGYEKVIPAPGTGDQVAEMDFLSAEHTASKEWGAKKKVVICKSCGAESVYDELQVSDVCPYCGATQVTQEADQDSITPTGVAPFEVTQEQASTNFKKWLKSGLFTPSKAKKSCNADSFTGIYLPYWTYDSRTTSQWNGEAGYEYEKKDREGNVHTEIRWRSVGGVHTQFIDDEVVCASGRHTDEILNRILPFNHEKLVPYKPEFVAGFVSERYSLGLKDGWELARDAMKHKIEASIEEEILHNYQADRARVSNVSTLFENITYKYVLFPIWMSSFKYKDKVYQFMVNGQTGRVGGKMPVSALRVLIAVLLAAGLIGLLVYLVNANG